MSIHRYKLPAQRAGFLFFTPSRAALAALLIVVLLLAGCAPAAEPAEEAPSVEEPVVEEAEPAAEEPAEEGVEEPAEDLVEEPASAYPITFVDAMDREVVIEARPEAIISLAPSITEILFAIGAGPQVVGRTDYCDYPSETESLPSIGGFDSASMSMETIISLEPDLIVAGSVLLHGEIVQALEDAGITAIVVEPNSVAEVQQAATVLGELTGNEETATALVADLESRVSAVTTTLEAVPAGERKTVFYEVWHEPLMTTTDQTFIGELVTLAGGVNIFADLEEDYPVVSAEQIIASDPVAIVGPSSHGDQLTAEMISARPGWESMTAVQTEAIYIVDGSTISRAGPRVVDALEEMAAALYPELFSE